MRLFMLIRQPENIEAAFAGADDILLAIDGVADGAAGIRTAKIRVPQKFAGAGVQSDEASFHTAAEHQVARGGKNSILGVTDHLEIPLFVASLRIDGADRAVSFLFGFGVGKSSVRASSGTDTGGEPAASGIHSSSGVALAFHPCARVALGRCAARIFPGWNVEEFCGRAIGRRIPVRAALVAG